MAFTEQGMAMLSSILNSERAISVNIAIMRTFVRFRRSIMADSVFLTRLDKAEQALAAVEKEQDEQSVVIHEVFAAFRRLVLPARET